MSFLLAALLFLVQEPKYATVVDNPGCGDACNISSAAPADWHQDIRKATFAVYQRQWDSDEKKFESRFICSAIAVAEVDDGYLLLTEGHCFADKDKPNLKYYVSEDSIDDPTLQTVIIDKYANTDKFDYAVLHLQTSREYPVFAVSFDDVPPVDTPVINVNFSFGITKQTAKGLVASHLMASDEGGAHCEICPGRYIATLGIGPGASGSAVIDEATHKVVGLVEGVFPGFAIGAVVMPMGKTFDDFLVDGSIMEKPPVEPPTVKKDDPPPVKSSLWARFWMWILDKVFGHKEPPTPTVIKFEM